MMAARMHPVRHGYRRVAAAGAREAFRGMGTRRKTVKNARIRITENREPLAIQDYPGRFLEP
jgi:hypothetical protein